MEKLLNRLCTALNFIVFLGKAVGVAVLFSVVTRVGGKESMERNDDEGKH